MSYADKLMTAIVEHYQPHFKKTLGHRDTIILPPLPTVPGLELEVTMRDTFGDGTEYRVELQMQDTEYEPGPRELHFENNNGYKLYPVICYVENSVSLGGSTHSGSLKLNKVTNKRIKELVQFLT